MPSRPRARRKKRVTLAELADQPFVQLAPTSSVREHIDAAVWPTQMRSVMEFEQLSTVAGMVRAGLGVTVVPALTLFHFAHRDLLTRPIQAPTLKREIFVIRPRDRSLSLAAQSLFELVLARRPRPAAITARTTASADERPIRPSNRRRP